MNEMIYCIPQGLLLACTRKGETKLYDRITLESLSIVQLRAGYLEAITDSGQVYDCQVEQGGMIKCESQRIRKGPNTYEYLPPDEWDVVMGRSLRTPWLKGDPVK